MSRPRRKILASLISISLALATVTIAIRSRLELTETRKTLTTAQTQAESDEALLARAQRTVASLKRQADEANALALSGAPESAEETPEQRPVEARKRTASNDSATALAALLERLSGPEASRNFAIKFDAYAELGRLAQAYPPARSALLALRDATEQRWRKDFQNVDAFSELSMAINALGDNDAKVALYEEFKDNKQLLSQVGFLAFEELVRRQRYDDAVIAFGYNKARSYLELGIERMRTRKDANPEKDQTDPFQLQFASIEALTGAGDFERAIELADRLLEYDASDEMVDKIARHLQRAGRGDLVSELQAQPQDEDQ